MERLQSPHQRGEEEEEEVVPFSLPRPPPAPREEEVDSLKMGGASYELVAGWGHPHDSVYLHTLLRSDWCTFEVRNIAGKQ